MMSDYKRFVSYLYEYISDKKMDNRGFVKVELRSGTCHMQFSLKVFSLPEQTVVTVYGYLLLNNLLQGFPLGELRAVKSGVTGTLTLPSRIAGTAYDVTDFNGLILMAPDGKFYGTQWDETLLLPSRFITNKNPVSGQPQTVGIPSDEPLPTTSPTEDTVSGNPDCTDSYIQEESNTNAEMSEAVESTAEAQTTQDSAEAALASKSKTGTASVLTSLKQTDSPSKTASSQNGADVRMASAAAVTAKANPWAVVQNSFSPIRPFADDEIAECVHISIRDFNALRSLGFFIGCNQFIHHSFQNYHHLILGKLSSAQKPVFILGVPGVYTTNEQFMAGMFGFSCFKPGRLPKEFACCGKSGYWYRPL